MNLNYNAAFVSDLHAVYKSNPIATASVIAEYAEKKFKSEQKRDIVFSTNCIAFEIGAHIAAFLISKKFKDISKPEGVSDSVFSKIMKHATPVDILEADVYNKFQSGAFAYFYGIRSKYQRSKKDPYYYYTGLLKRRATPANSAWKAIKL